MLLIIDNYDSFTYNLVQYFQCLKQEVIVYTHDQISLKQIKHLAPDHLVMNFIAPSLFLVSALATNVLLKSLVEQLSQLPKSCTVKPH
jgi:hypothetical protein